MSGCLEIDFVEKTPPYYRFHLAVFLWEILCLLGSGPP